MRRAHHEESCIQVDQRPRAAGGAGSVGLVVPLPRTGARARRRSRRPPAGRSRARPAMTVTVVKPVVIEWQTRLDADGSVAAWQEVSISPEVGGLRIAEVLVNVGDRVDQGPGAGHARHHVGGQRPGAADRRRSRRRGPRWPRRRANAARARKLQDSGRDQRPADQPVPDCRADRAGPRAGGRGADQVRAVAHEPDQRHRVRRRRDLRARRHSGRAGAGSARNCSA